MQEGILSLMQMAKTSAAVRRAGNHDGVLAPFQSSHMTDIGGFLSEAPNVCQKESTVRDCNPVVPCQWSNR